MRLCPLNKGTGPERVCDASECQWWDKRDANCCVPVLCERMAGLENSIIYRLYGLTPPKEKP